MPLRRRVSRPDSFSLVELLVVLAIIAILALISLPSIFGVVRSSHLTSAGNNLIDQLNLARQTAMARNCEVEFRFYQLPAAGAGVSSAPAVFRAFQVYSLDNGGAQTNAVTQVIYFPPDVAMTNSAAYSTLIPTTPSNPPYVVSGTTVGIPLGPYPPTSYNYADFHFKPNGGTDLNPSSASTWFVSLVNVHDASVGPNGLPNNFFTVQVDSLSGRARSFRPQ